MEDSLRWLLDDIADEARRIASEAELSAYRRHGGVFDPQIDHVKMLADLGVKRAARASARFVELRTAMRRWYGFNPARMFEHAGLAQRGFRRGWFRRSASPVNGGNT
jgi:hypothetical protein